MKPFLLSALLWTAFAGAAGAYCPAPGRAPAPPQSYDKPRPPACLENARYNRENDCDARELDRYQRDVDAYIRRLENFAADARRFAEEAADYASCEAQEARETYNG